LLENKNPVIYGAGLDRRCGGLRLRPRGARVFLSGRTLESFEEVAEEISSAGGVAETEQVDALDERVVDIPVDAVAEKARSHAPNRRRHLATFAKTRIDSPPTEGSSNSYCGRSPPS
jgi:hypothetical protein